jgi:hypothetical protein
MADLPSAYSRFILLLKASFCAHLSAMVLSRLRFCLLTVWISTGPNIRRPEMAGSGIDPGRLMPISLMRENTAVRFTAKLAAARSKQRHGVLPH